MFMQNSSATMNVPVVLVHRKDTASYAITIMTIIVIQGAVIVIAEAQHVIVMTTAAAVMPGVAVSRAETQFLRGALL